MDQIVRGRFGFQMNFSSISADWHRRTEFRSTGLSLSAANMRWIIWKKEKREIIKPTEPPLVFNCKIITVLYEVACWGKRQEPVQGQGRLVFSKFPRKSRIRPTVCSKRIFSCYFWRKSNQNVGVGCAIKDVGNCLALPHKQCPQKLLLPATVHTPPHPRFRTALASSLLIGRVAANLIEERKLLLRRNKYACQKKVYIRISCVCHLNFLSALSHSHIPVKGVWGFAAPEWQNRRTCSFCTRRC